MRTILSSAILAFAIVAQAQISTPQPSPVSTIEQKVGISDFSISYSRPSVKGRVIFGDLVPYGEMWRTGANASTKLKFSDEVSINGALVPAGEYALYTIPGKDEWTIILHKNLSYWGTGGDKYNTDEDQLRFTVKPQEYKETVETLTMQFAHIRDKGCEIELIWENTRVSFEVALDFDAKVMAQIKDAMTISQGTYYRAARYYYENGKDLEQALEWINKACEGNEQYWNTRQQALILAGLERYEEAIAAAERSKVLAAEAGNTNYVKFNDESIAEWSAKK